MLQMTDSSDDSSHRYFVSALLRSFYFQTSRNKEQLRNHFKCCLMLENVKQVEISSMKDQCFCSTWRFMKPFWWEILCVEMSDVGVCYRVPDIGHCRCCTDSRPLVLSWHQYSCRRQWNGKVNSCSCIPVRMRCASFYVCLLSLLHIHVLWWLLLQTYCYMLTLSLPNNKENCPEFLWWFWHHLQD